MSSFLLDGLTTTDALADVFSDQSVLQAMLRVESALAHAEARSRAHSRDGSGRDRGLRTARPVRRRGDRQGRASIRKRYDSAREGADRAGPARGSRGRGVRPLGRDEPGHCGLRVDAAARPGRRSGSTGPLAIAGDPAVALRGTRADADAGADAAAARAAHHVRPEGRRLVRGARSRVDAPLGRVP